MDGRSVLKNSYLFRNVSDNDLDSVLALTERKRFHQGELVYAAGSDADAIFFVEMGTVDITVKGKEIPIITAGTGRVQRWGDPIEEVHAGDVVIIATFVEVEDAEAAVPEPELAVGMEAPAVRPPVGQRVAQPAHEAASRPTKRRRLIRPPGFRSWPCRRHRARGPCGAATRPAAPPPGRRGTRASG